MARLPSQTDLMSMIKDLERRMRIQETAPRLRNAAVGQGGLRFYGGGSATFEDGGGVTIRDGGGLTVDGTGRADFTSGGSALFRDHQGREYAYMGGLSTNGFGVLLRRLDGTLALVFADDDPDNETLQLFGLYDRAGAALVADDASGDGMRRPFAPLRFARSRFTDWPAVTSGAFERVYEASIYKHNPQAFVTIRATTDASGTTGEVRVMLDGVQVGAVPVGFSVDYTTVGPFDVPGGFLSQHSIHVEARRTAGTGNVRLEVTSASGFAA